MQYRLLNVENKSLLIINDFSLNEKPLEYMFKLKLILPAQRTNKEIFLPQTST